MKTHSPDTHPEAEEQLIALMRKASLSQKFALVRSLSSLVIRLSKRAIQRANPHLSQRELALLFLELHYGSELSESVRRYLASRDH